MFSMPQSLARDAISKHALAAIKHGITRSEVYRGMIARERIQDQDEKSFKVPRIQS
jgi:hypothetical protein